MKKIVFSVISILLLSLLSGCEQDNIDPLNSIFDRGNIRTPNEFDYWLYDNFVSPYNIDVKYYFNYQESNQEYPSLTPVIFKNATRFTQLLKLCWVETYAEAINNSFVRQYFPREIILVGSPGVGIAGNSVTALKGEASSGVSIAFYDLNNLKSFTPATLFEHIHIMNHEFFHILDQNKVKDASYQQLSEERFKGDLWADFEKAEDAYKLGFVSAYSSYDAEEDFAEIFSVYLTSTDKQWADILSKAEAIDPDTNEPTADGKIIIEAKLDEVKKYTRERWGFELDDLKIILRRRLAQMSSYQFTDFNQYSK